MSKFRSIDHHIVILARTAVQRQCLRTVLSAPRAEETHWTNSRTNASQVEEVFARAAYQNSRFLSCSVLDIAEITGLSKTVCIFNYIRIHGVIEIRRNLRRWTINWWILTLRVRVVVSVLRNPSSILLLLNWNSKASWLSLVSIADCAAAEDASTSESSEANQHSNGCSIAHF